MQEMPSADLSLEFHPLTPDRLADLERLFGARGASGGCWCMWWRLPRAQFVAQKGDVNRLAFRSIVDSGTVPGILAYAGAEPVGWCAVEPRSQYPRLERSRSLKSPDSQPVWSITCFFVSRDYRRLGVSVELLKAAADHVRSQGGRIVEGYPVVPRSGGMPDAFAWTGPLRAYERAGFTVSSRPSPSRAIVRKNV